MNLCLKQKPLQDRVAAAGAVPLLVGMLSEQATASSRQADARLTCSRTRR